MARYTQEVKDKAVAAAKAGMHLKEIQTTIGPNPKATMRYLAKAGIDYKDLLKELKAAGKAPKTLVQKSKAKTAEKKQNSKTPVKEVVEN